MKYGLKALTFFMYIGGEDMKISKKLLSICLMLAMIVSQLHPIVITKAATNILTGKTYTNSTYSTSKPSYAVDGNVSSYWDLGYWPDKPWITFDLGGLYEVDSVNVVNYYAANDRYYHWDVLASTDGVNFITVGEKRGNDKATSTGDTITFETPVYATHLKFVGVFNSANAGFHFNELSAYGEEASDVDPVLLAKQLLNGYLMETYYESDYTAASWKAYMEATSEGKTILEKEDVTAEEIDDVSTLLRNAIDNLEVGNPDEKVESTFRVGTFNLWVENPSHPDVEGIAAFIDRLQLDYVGLQEVDKNNGRDNRDVLTLIDHALDAGSDFDYLSMYRKAIDYMNGEYGLGQISATPLKETSSGAYALHGGEETRVWQRMVVNRDGLDVAIYNTNLTYQGTSVEANRQNIQELVEILDNDPCEYKVVVGDFNASGDDMLPFTKNYDLVSGKDGQWYVTSGLYGENGDGKPGSDSNNAIDNIIVSKNIEVVNTRLAHHGGLSDHHLLYSDLKLMTPKAYLQKLIDACDYSADDYTSASYTSYQEVLAQAKEVLASATDDKINAEVSEMAQTLLDAINALEEETKTNYALNKEVYVKDMEGGWKEDGTPYYDFFQPSNVTDGIIDDINMNGNRISLDSTQGNYMSIDLGKVYDFDQIVIDAFPEGKELNVYTSKDGSEWTPLYELVVAAPVSGKLHRNVISLSEKATARYVKFEQPVIPMPDSIYNYKWGIAEVKVLGKEVDLNPVNALLAQARNVKEEYYSEASVATLKEAVESVSAIIDASNAQVDVDEAYALLKEAFYGLDLKSNEESELKNVASLTNGAVADADSITVVGGDKTFLNNDVYKDFWTAASAATPVSAKVDFDKKYAVESVRVIFKEQDTTDKLLGFTLYYVDATGKQVELYQGTSYNEANDATTLDLGHKFFSEYALDEAIVMKGLKVTVTSNTTGSEVAIAEIQAFGREVQELTGEKNLALGAKVDATQYISSSLPSKAVDGVTSGAYWNSGTGMPHALTVDLGESCTITKMVAYPYYADGRYYFYDMEVSLDGTSWVKVASREETYGTQPGIKGETYTFAPYYTARYVRFNALHNSNGSGQFHLMEFEVYGISNAVNVALGKSISATGGSSPAEIVDGDLQGYWDGGETPQSFTIDLDSAYNISRMKAFPYVGDRWYDYDIEVSVDAKTWVPVANRQDTHGTIPAFVGETYEFDEPVYGRFVRVTMTYNSANPSVHMREFEVYGEIDPNYQAPDIDVQDPDNVAFGKPVHSHLNTNSLEAIVDGFDDTVCTGDFAPAYFDIDLEENYELSDIEVKFPIKQGRYYYFTIYGSEDGTNYDRLYQERSQVVPENGKYTIDLSELDNTTYRIVRVFVEYVSDSNTSVLGEVRVHGNATGENTEKLLNDYTLADGTEKDINVVETILDMEAYDESEYAAPITEAEIIENVYGIIDRIIGEQYRDWFTFELVNDPTKTKDWYSVEFDQATNKVVIKGNEGLSLSSGLNYYLKNYCHVAVSEQSLNGKMPEQIVPVLEKVTKENQVEVRYAFNYCTLNYTFSYADAEKFQREYDWMALNGVNCVLDLAGQEAVWIMFLMNFGYTYDEAKDWIAGGTYYAWQFMDNMEIIGGPVADEWVKGRLEMARANQRWKVSLGMETVLQGYAGMIPNNFGKFQPDVEILQQGTWAGTPRPDMIRTDGALYDEYAELFYEAQHWAFGATSNYYAVDPFHEGGIRPSDLTDDVIAANVLESLLKYDEDAVWMVQAWWANPTNALLNGMGDYREDHVLILDLMGLNSQYNTPYWQLTSYHNGATVLDDDEFNSTSWVWCLLENYGGNPGMDGRAEEAIKRIQYAYENAEHMKGIGLISEATYDNPFIYDLVFDLAWVSLEELQATTPEAFLTNWKDLWVTSRYGVDSENAKEAWDILIDTLYSGSTSPSQIVLSKNPSLASYGSRYSFNKVEKALKLLYEDFDVLSQSECYRYDLSELMRQIVSNHITELCGSLKTAHTSGDVDAFRVKKDEFLAAFDLLDEVTATQQDLMVGEWVGSAADWATDTGADDFAYDTMTINAKTLITVWAPSTSLSTYAYRHYNGIIRDIYKPIWEAYLTRLEEEMAGQEMTTPSIDYTKQCMEWIYTPWASQIQSESNPDGYALNADNSVANMDVVTAKVLDTVVTIDPINVGNIAYEKDVETNAESPNSPGAPGGGYATHVTDGVLDTYWDGVTWDVEEGKEPYVIIDLEKVYDIDKLNVVNYASGTRYYYYDVYASLDGKEWNQIADREETYGTTASSDAGDDYVYETNKPRARYLKLVGLYNSSNEGFHVKEIRAYGNEVTLADYTEVETAIASAQSLNKEEYINYASVEEAINAVVYGKDASEQEIVNGYATAINEAMNALVKLPKQATNVKAEVNDYKTITLTWDVEETAEKYIVERYTSDGEWIVVNTVETNSFVAAGLKTGKEYTYRVRSIKIFDDTLYEAEASEEVKVTPMLSGSVTLNINKNGEHKFDLSWNKIDGATRYIIYRKNGDDEWKKVLTLGKDATTYTSKTMAAGTYAYQVKAARYDSIDRVMSEGSNIVEGIVEAALLKPSDVTLETQGTTMTLTWNKVEGMRGYEIYRSKDGGVFRHIKTTTSTTLTNTSLKAGSTYTYKIRAYTTVNGEKVYGAEVETQTITIE